MTSRTSLLNSYYLWLLDKINARETSFQELYRYLHRKEFYAILPLDQNRGSDGQSLRNEFLLDYAMENDIDAEDLDISQGPSSIFEMMIALASRCEKFMHDENKGDRTGYWFHMMIFNLGLDLFTDDNFYLNKEKYHLDDIIEKFLDRKYGEDGKGGLFPLRKSVPRDQSKTEIWYQMMDWLNENGYVDEYLVR